MTPKEADKILGMFLHKQCDLKRTEFAYDQSEVWLAVKTANDALEKQIPKKPIKSEKFLKSKHTVTVAVCPNCNSSLGLCNYAKTTFIYCGDCGQALDWSDTE